VQSAGTQGLARAAPRRLVTAFTGPNGAERRLRKHRP
jgi:hypothetical protein